MTKFDPQDHHQRVNEFLEQAKEQNEEAWKETCEKNPVLTQSKWRSIRRREQSVGLLGTHPSNISADTASRYDYESAFEGDEEE